MVHIYFIHILQSPPRDNQAATFGRFSWFQWVNYKIKLFGSKLFLEMWSLCLRTSCLKFYGLPRDGCILSIGNMNYRDRDSLSTLRDPSARVLYIATFIITFKILYFTINYVTIFKKPKQINKNILFGEI